MTGLSPDFYSENIEMYLVTIARLSKSGDAVPLSSVAGLLEISVVSANEMCRKLHENRLVNYRPYKGVVLTGEGFRRAQHVLRSHRIWEVFLVGCLGFPIQEAHRQACQLEHVTSARLADLLFEYLGRPPVSPNGDSIPPAEGEPDMMPDLSLDDLATGQVGLIHDFDESEVQKYFSEQGIYPGHSISVLSKTKEVVLVKSENGKRISLANKLACGIRILPQQS